MLRSIQVVARNAFSHSKTNNGRGCSPFGHTPKAAAFPSILTMSSPCARLPQARSLTISRASPRPCNRFQKSMTKFENVNKKYSTATSCVALREFATHCILFLFHTACAGVPGRAAPTPQSLPAQSHESDRGAPIAAFAQSTRKSVRGFALWRGASVTS